MFTTCRRGSTNPICSNFYACQDGTKSAEQCRQEGIPTNSTPTAGKKNYEERGNAYMIPGFIVLGVGAALIVTAIIVHVQSVQSTYAKQQKASRVSALPAANASGLKVTLETSSLP